MKHKLPRIKVPKRYVDRLRKEGLEEKWLTNFLQRLDRLGWRSEAADYRLYRIRTASSWHEFINVSLCWSETNEGLSFWNNIANRRER